MGHPVDSALVDAVSLWPLQMDPSVYYIVQCQQR
jgi:hypothetical protein